jgi:molybdate transport system substrate-binding protein
LSSAARAGLAPALAAALLAGGCGGTEDLEPEPVTLNVYAASSLTEAFAELEATFERTHSDVDVALSFAGSQVLRIQIEEGAPADVFASANPEHMEALIEAGLVQSARVMAANELVVIVPADNPSGVASFEDLPAARRLVLGTPDVPVGRYAREVLARADSLLRPGFRAAVLANLVSEESNVRLARAKVELGEADAAIVYVTDAVGSDRVRSVPIPGELNVRALYLIGAVERAGASELAEEWIELVRSPGGRAVLTRHGFVPE